MEVLITQFLKGVFDYPMVSSYHKWTLHLPIILNIILLDNGEDVNIKFIQNLPGAIESKWF